MADTIQNPPARAKEEKQKQHPHQRPSSQKATGKGWGADGRRPGSNEGVPWRSLCAAVLPSRTPGGTASIFPQNAVNINYQLLSELKRRDLKC